MKWNTKSNTIKLIKFRKILGDILPFPGWIELSIASGEKKKDTLLKLSLASGNNIRMISINEGLAEARCCQQIRISS